MLKIPAPKNLENAFDKDGKLDVKLDMGTINIPEMKDIPPIFPPNMPQCPFNFTFPKSCHSNIPNRKKKCHLFKKLAHVVNNLSHTKLDKKLNDVMKKEISNIKLDKKLTDVMNKDISNTKLDEKQTEETIEEKKLIYNFTGEEKAGDCIMVEVGPIWSHKDYLNRKDKEWANAFPGWALTGHWNTTVPNEMSIVQFKKEEKPKEEEQKEEEQKKEEQKEEQPKEEEQMEEQPLKELLSKINEDINKSDFKGLENKIKDTFSNEKKVENLLQNFITCPKTFFNGIGNIFETVVTNIGENIEQHIIKPENNEEEKLNQSTELYEDAKEEMEEQHNLLIDDDDKIFKSAIGECDDDLYNEEDKKEELDDLQNYNLKYLEEMFPQLTVEQLEEIVRENKGMDLFNLIDIVFEKNK